MFDSTDKCSLIISPTYLLNVWTDNTGIVELDINDVHDIDTQDDWKIAELKFQIQNKLKAK